MAFLQCDFYDGFRCVFDMKVMSHWWHWHGFSSVWVIWWYTNWSFNAKALSQWLHWYGFSPEWVLGWLYVLLLWKPCHIGYSNIFSSQCEIFDEFEDYIFVKQLYYIGCIDMVYPQCEFFGDIQAVISMQKLCYTGSIDRVSLQCELYDGFQGVLCFCCESLVTLVALIWFLLSVGSLMNFKIT